MSGMAGVVLMHSQIGRDEFGQFCKGCGHHYGYAAERTLHRKEFDHVADMLTAAGFGPVKEAWDEGYTTGNAHNGRRDANPYRAAAVRDA